MRSIIYLLLKIADILLSPFTLISALWLKFVRRYLVKYWENHSVVSRHIFNAVGVFPIIDHYYEPRFNYNKLSKSLRDDRNLPGVDLNQKGQLELLTKFCYQEELKSINKLPASQTNYSFENKAFRSGDSEILYSMIRHYKPRKIIEVGSGNSTLMAQHAIQKSVAENAQYSCEHICIEPYEMPWLEKLNAKVIRKLVENVDLTFFNQLEENDILFIDSSHMVRPHGDVLFEFLEILPTLKKGVIVHVHDIFTPKDYVDNWLKEGVVFWNEQYLLEAFLSMNSGFEVICGLNYLKHNHYESLHKVCPHLDESREPGSFWIRKTK